MYQETETAYTVFELWSNDLVTHTTLYAKTEAMAVLSALQQKPNRTAEIVAVWAQRADTIICVMGDDGDPINYAEYMAVKRGQDFEKLVQDYEHIARMELEWSKNV